MKINEDKIKSNNKFKTFYNSNSSTKLLPNNNKFKKNSLLTPNLFKNHELQKSLSIKINNSNKTPTKIKFSQNYTNPLDSKNSFLTIIPINSTKKDNLPQIGTYFQDDDYNLRNRIFSVKERRSKKSFELKCFNDEKCFSTTKPTKAFLHPKNYFIIKQYRVSHDTNIFNLKHVLTDYTKQYDRNSYKIKKIIQNDMFINKIKKDLLKLKFNNRIKPFDDL